MKSNFRLIQFHQSLAKTVAGVANQLRPQTATMLKPVSTKTLIFDGKNDKLELFENVFHSVLEIQPKRTKRKKIKQFHAHLRQEALETLRNISAPN